MKHVGRALLIASFTTACAGSDGKNGAAGSDGADGSSCHVEDNHDGTATISCDDGSEATVSNGMDGEPGKDGAPGTDGAAGAPGADAETTAITESILCTGTLENTALGFSYNAVLFGGSGDLFVAASVNSPLNSASDTKFFAPSQVGYATATVSFRFDQDGTADGGWFSLSLDRETLVVHIDYRASDPGDVTDAWTMDPAACVHNDY